MNGFVVMLVRSLDSEPVGLFPTRRQAERFVARMSASGTDDGPKLPEGSIGSQQAGTLGALSRVYGAVIVEFRAGRPVAK